MMIIVSVLIAVVFAIAMAVIYGCEMHANNKRIERGEPVKRHHDATDYEIVNVIDWSRRG